MSTLIGLCFAVALISILSFIFYPQTSISKIGQSARVIKAMPNKTYAHVWPDVVDDLASAIRAGLSLPQAVLLLAESGPTETKSLLTEAMNRYEITGDFVGALNVLSHSAKDPIVDKFVSALQIAYEVGGTDLGILLRNLSEVIREDNKLRGEIDARQSWTINGARLAIAAPWVTVIILGSRESALEAYLSSSGLTLLFFCAIFSALAYFLMLKIGGLPKSPRIRS